MWLADVLELLGVDLSHKFPRSRPRWGPLPSRDPVVCRRAVSHFLPIEKSMGTFRGLTRT